MRVRARRKNGNSAFSLARFSKLRKIANKLVVYNRKLANSRFPMLSNNVFNDFREREREREIDDQKVSFGKNQT